MIEIKNVSKSYRKSIVLDNVNLSILDKKKYYFLGKNGSGKTTLAKIILGIETATKGTVNKDKNIIISYLSQEPIILDFLTISEYVSYSLRKNQKSSSLLEKNLKKWNLWDDRFCLLKEASGGMRQKTALISILTSNANVLILDEPYNMLDIESKELLNKEVKLLDKTIIIITHEKELDDSFNFIHFNGGQIKNAI